MNTLKALVVSNDLFELESMFTGNEYIEYRFTPVERDFRLDMSGVDLLIVPNGCDHVAMLKVRAAVREFLHRGGALFCFDGWFTDWIPGHRWVHSNEKATRDIRYSVQTDRHGLFEGVNLDDLQFNHGISGWWACGYIEAAPGSDILLVDTWGRPMIVVDETSTPGLLILTASGPLGDFSYEGTVNGLSILYQNMLHYVLTKTTRIHAIT